MIDESTDISSTGHVVVFGTFVDEGLPISVFLGLFEVPNYKKDAGLIFEGLQKRIKEWSLDVEKCVSFGSDRCSTMVDHLTAVSTRLKAVSPFLINIHCIAHGTNLAALQAAQCVDCKKMSSEIDNMVNLLVEMSGKKKYAVIALQKELNDAQKSLQRFYKIRWLSRYQAICTLSDSLELVLVFFRNYPESKVKVRTPLLYFKLRTFKYIYVLSFLVDLLHSLSILSKVFQYKYVDVTTIGSLIRIQIESIRMLYVVDSTDLNQDTFNANVDYHVIPQYGPPGGYLQKLSSEIRRSIFHSKDMIKDPKGIDLEEALNFQKSYAEAVCKCLEARFSDNGIISAFKILIPSNMPSKRVGLNS